MARDRVRRYWSVVALSFLLVVFFTILDLAGAHMWGLIGGWGGAAYVGAGAAYQSLFWGFAYSVAVIIALVYFFAVRDYSESLALLLVPIVLLQFGVEDVLFYFFGGFDLWHSTMSWLTGNLWIPTLISWAVGVPIITGWVLFVSAILGVITAIILAVILGKAKW